MWTRIFFFNKKTFWISSKNMAGTDNAELISLWSVCKCNGLKDEFWDKCVWAVCRLPQSRPRLFARGESGIESDYDATIIFGSQRGQPGIPEVYKNMELGDVAMTGRFCLGLLDKWCRRK